MVGVAAGLLRRWRLVRSGLCVAASVCARVCVCVYHTGRVVVGAVVVAVVVGLRLWLWCLPW